MEQPKLSNLGTKLLSMIEFDADERVICEVRKHPFGLFLIYLAGLFVAVVLFSVFLGAVWFMQNDLSAVAEEVPIQEGILTSIGLGLALLSLGATYIAGYIYSHNIMIVTTEKVAQVLYQSMFNRKVSQLSIGDVQDVTVSQNGVFPRLLNYGTIVIETAGEQKNYKFTFAPNPYKAAKSMVGAHEKNLEKFGN